jgi:hemerythrin-like domain-containing protein
MARDKNAAKQLANKTIAKLNKRKNEEEETRKKQICDNAVAYIQNLVNTKLN